MIIDNSDALKNWLVSCLGGISDADPAALAKYVLALVKKDKPLNELYSFVLDQLDIFLHKDTKYFVDLLFETLKTNSYLYSTHKTTSDTPESTLKVETKPKSENILPSTLSQTTSHNSATKVGTGSLIQEKEYTYDVPLTLADEKFKRIPPSAAKGKKYEHEKTENSTERDISYLVDREKGVIQPSNFSNVKLSNSHSFSHLHNDPPLSISIKKEVDEKISKRCKDYDEKGYCMKGDLCQFDHGSDPVVVEDVSILNFNVSTASENIVPSTLVSESQELPQQPFQPPLPPSPPRLPPLPPLPSPNFILDGYNPESPGMNPLQDHNQHSSYYVPFKTGIHIPSHNSSTSAVQNQPQLKPLRSRELIGVPTVQIEKVTSSTGLPLKENPLSILNEHDISSKKRKGDVHSRLGPPNPKRYAFDDKPRNTLLVRKIPKHLNNISELNNHFSKFGTVTNIQVSFNGNPEDALVKFQNHYEAVAAYKSTEAVLNNRFIKVFWHSNFDFDTAKPDSFPTSSAETRKNAVHTFVPKTQISQNKIPESSVSYSTKGNLCRTVFNHASFVSKKADATPPVKSQKEDKKEVLNKRLALHKKAQEFLDLQIQHQKLILAHLSKAKNEKEKLFLKKTIQDLSTTIIKLQADQKKSGEGLKKLVFKSTRSKSDIEKELLDAEIDLYKQQNSGSDTSTRILLSKINELKQRAKSLGLLDPSRPVDMVKKFPVKPVSSDLLKIDNRPKILLVSNFPDKDVLKKHFQQFGKLERVEDNKLGITICFNTRKAAEMALLNGKQLGNIKLSLSWFRNRSSSEEMDNSTDNKEKDAINFIDEDEEDTEGRSWR